MRFATLSVLGPLLITSLAVACGSSSDDSNHAAPDASTTDNDAVAPPPPADDAGVDAQATYPAAHPAMPQVADLGGPTLAKPKVIPIYFANYDYETQIQDYLGKLAPSSFWKANVTEYGVGPLTVGSKINLAETAPASITDAQIQAWLSSMLDGTHPEWGAPDTSAIYTIFYPTQTVISLSGGGGGPKDAGVPDASSDDASVDDSGADASDDDASLDAGIVDAGHDASDGGGRRGGQTSCKAFGGYHSNIVIAGKSIAYAVIPECPTFGDLKGVDVVTASSSHELIEAVTDPFPNVNPAYAQADDDHIVWELTLGGGETGDMCAQFDSSFVKDTEIGYYVQRSWSNAAAKAGHDPCVPAPAGEVYFNSAPNIADNFAVLGGSTKAVKIAVGQSKTIDVVLFSDGPTDAWSVDAIELKSSDTAPDTLQFSFDKNTGKNGDVLKLTITAVAASTARTGASTFMIQSTLGALHTDWFGYVSR